MRESRVEIEIDIDHMEIDIYYMNCTSLKVLYGIKKHPPSSKFYWLPNPSGTPGKFGGIARKWRCEDGPN